VTALTFQAGVSHIDRGVRGSRTLCPLALALRDHLRSRDGTEWLTVTVSESGVYTCWDSQAVGASYRHTAESATFVALFDSGQKTAAAMLAGRMSLVGGFRLVEAP
jgi:hypothetical protein